jgi:hypothetical protein
MLLTLCESRTGMSPCVHNVCIACVHRDVFLTRQLVVEKRIRHDLYVQSPVRGVAQHKHGCQVPTGVDAQAPFSSLSSSFSTCITANTCAGSASGGWGRRSSRRVDRVIRVVILRGTYRSLKAIRSRHGHARVTSNHEDVLLAILFHQAAERSVRQNHLVGTHGDAQLE